MNPEEAVALACSRCVTAASLLAAARLPVGVDDRTLGRALAAGVVCGWADETSVGTANATGITVRERGEAVATRVQWAQVAVAIRPALREPGVVERLSEAYDRYVAAATKTSVAARLEAKAATAELAQLRRELLTRGREGVPFQQSLFPAPPNRGRSLA